MKILSADRQPSRHHPALIAMHWIMATMVTLAFIIIIYRLWVEDSDQRRILLDTHRSVGLAILVFLFFRIAIRLTWGRESPFFLTPFLRIVSGISHASLYLLLLILPLLGWAQSSARAHHFKVFGVPLPSLVSYDVDLADKLGEWHETLAWIFLGLIGVHFVAALWHHFGRRDGVLHSMLPGRTPPAS